MTTDLQVVADYLAASTVVAFDFETAPRRDWQGDGTAALDPHRGEIVGISLAVAARADHQPGPSISPSATAILLAWPVTSRRRPCASLKKYDNVLLLCRQLSIIKLNRNDLLPLRNEQHRCQC